MVSRQGHQSGRGDAHNCRARNKEHARREALTRKKRDKSEAPPCRRQLQHSPAFRGQRLPGASRRSSRIQGHARPHGFPERGHRLLALLSTCLCRWSGTVLTRRTAEHKHATHASVTDRVPDEAENRPKATEQRSSEDIRHNLRTRCAASYGRLVRLHPHREQERNIQLQPFDGVLPMEQQFLVLHADFPVVHPADDNDALPDFQPEDCLY